MSFLRPFSVLLTRLLQHPPRYYSLNTPFCCIFTTFSGSFPSAFIYKQNAKSLFYLKKKKESSWISFSSGRDLCIFSPVMFSVLPPCRQLLTTPLTALQFTPHPLSSVSTPPLCSQCTEHVSRAQLKVSFILK